MPKSPTLAYTKKACERLGWMADICERRHAKGFGGEMQWGHRVDLFGFADLVACDDDGVVLLQVTSDRNVASRINKMMDVPVRDRVLRLLRVGVRIEVWGWRKIAVGRRELWDARRIRVCADGPHLHREDMPSYLEVRR